MHSLAIVRATLAVGMIGLLAGCGAGGGGGAAAYTITLRADKTELPLNIASVGPNIGGPYTTTLYVDARDNAGNPIPGGTGIFGCAVVGSLDSGPLYYLDGKPEHETKTTVNGAEITTQNAYRSITLDSNSGGATFHYHATDIAGTATVRCTVTDPDNVQRSADLSIQVGGSPSGKVSQIVASTESPNYLWVQGTGGTTHLQVQFQLVDEAGQKIANPASGVDNLLVSIVPDAASLAENDATLRGVNGAGQAVAGSAIRVQSINGQAQITLVSGSNPGSILLMAQADRDDNDVDNGIGEPIYNYVAVSAVTQAPMSATPVAIATATLPAATSSIPYAALLEATGGTAPYTWSIVSGGLSGLGMMPSGVLYGLPSATTSGVYPFVVKVTDAMGTTVSKQFTVQYTYTAPPVYTPTPPPTLVVTPATVSAPVSSSTLTFVITGGSPNYAATSNNAAVATTSPVTSSGGQYHFTATLVAAGSTTLIVTDGSGQAKTVTLTVTP